MGNKQPILTDTAEDGASLQPAFHSIPQKPKIQGRDMRTDYLNKLGLGKFGKGPQPPQNYDIPNWLKDYKVEPVDDTKPTDYESFADNEAYNLTVHVRSNDEIRVRFLQRISTLKQWVPASERSPVSQTIIIYDWDDTLLCTSFLNQLPDALNISDREILAKLKSLEQSVVDLLKQSSSLGENYIITNAMKGWVEYSSSRWLPEVLPLLENMKIVSARSDYEQLYPGNYHLWKEQAFLQIPQMWGTDPVTNLVVLGDSMVEMDAAKTLKACYARACIKTIKFQDSPGPEELTKQLCLVTSKFQHICTSAKDMTIRLERRFGSRD